MKKSKKSSIKYINKKNRKRKIFRVISVFLLICVTYNIIYFINTRITKKNYLEIFGTCLLQMTSDNMKGDLNKDDLVFVEKTEPNYLKVGDIIAYRVKDEVRIDKIHKILDGEYENTKKFVTKSNKALYPNSEYVSEKELIGKVSFSIPILGYITKILQTRVAMIIAFFIVLLAVSNTSYKEAKYRQRRKKKQVLA